MHDDREPLQIWVPQDAQVFREESEILKKLERRALTKLKEGDKSELLHFIANCFACRSAVPDWAAEMFHKAVLKSFSKEIRSWDEVFGRPIKKGTHLRRAKRKFEIGSPIRDRVNQRHAAGEPLDKVLFELVGEEFGVGGTFVSDLYYAWKKFDEGETSGKF
jgi:hypothetical protein